MASGTASNSVIPITARMVAMKKRIQTPHGVPDSAGMAASASAASCVGVRSGGRSASARAPRFPQFSLQRGQTRKS